MNIEQIYTGCLAQGAYYIESEGEAAIIDPLREVQPYIDKAARDNAKIKYVFETHFHADFVSGHLDLAKRTGAKIIYGPTAKPGFAATVAKDGQEFPLGKLKLVVLHTPGHTMESSCFLLKDETGKDIALFTGDTLFIGDVGRPDLAQKAANKTREELAGILYTSLHEKILPLADDVILYPAHGEGSACGKHLGKERSDTLGHQRQVNYALADIPKEEFIRQVLDGLTPPPGYFPANALMNRSGYESFDEVAGRGLHPLTPDAFEKLAGETSSLILDTRPGSVFCKGFIPNAINIGLDGSFAPWAGTLIKDIRQPILLVTEPGRESESVTRLARVGYDHCIGYLEGGMDVWIKAGKGTDQIPEVNAHELHHLLRTQSVHLVDVRKKGEYDSGHLNGALNLPLDEVNERMNELDRGQHHYVYCASGYRSPIFISILKARGYEKLVDVRGGFRGLQASGGFDISRTESPVTAE